jgi:hypothetical protein
VASNKGIGTVMMIASGNFDVPMVFAGLFLLAAMGVVSLYAHLVPGRAARDRLVAAQDRSGDGLMHMPPFSSLSHAGAFMRTRLSRRAAVVAIAALASIAALLPAREAAAQPVTPIKFVLDWKLQGIHAWYYLAEDKGYFAEPRSSRWPSTRAKAPRPP